MPAEPPVPGLTADHTTRIITGLIVPYGRLGKTAGRQFRFAPRALMFPTRLWLVRDHDQAQRVGRALRVQETPAGPVGVFRVLYGPAGDAALAAVGRAGLSPGVDSVESRPDPQHRGAYLITFAACYEVSITEQPAFDWRLT